MNATEREEDRTLGVLRAVSEESNLSQRRLARHLNVALGLANSYLKRCVRKGWVKVHQVPGNRYLYYLTPRGFAEKGRLTALYLSKSMSFYRQAGLSCAEALQRWEIQKLDPPAEGSTWITTGSLDESDSNYLVSWRIRYPYTAEKVEEIRKIVRGENL